MLILFDVVNVLRLSRFRYVSLGLRLVLLVLFRLLVLIGCPLIDIVILLFMRMLIKFN